MKDIELIKVGVAESYAEAQQMIDYLRKNGIAAFRRGGVMDIYTGNSRGGEDILTDPKDAEKARMLLKEFTPIKTSGSGNRKTVPRGQKIICGILLAVILIVCVGIPIIFL